MITWGEFKKAAETAGVKDKDEIRYIDFSMVYTLPISAFELYVNKPVTLPDGAEVNIPRSWAIWD